MQIYFKSYNRYKQLSHFWIFRRGVAGQKTIRPATPAGIVQQRQPCFSRGYKYCM